MSIIASTAISSSTVWPSNASLKGPPAENPKEYFRRTITIPILDHLLAEMETRFSKHQQTAIYGLYLIPSIMTTKSLREITSKFTELEEMYGEDLPHSSSLQSEVHSWYLMYGEDLPHSSSLQSEVHSWYRKWREQKEEHGIQSLPTNLTFTLPHASALYPNIRVLLLILCTLPVTSCSSERSFSGLNTYLTYATHTLHSRQLRRTYATYTRRTKYRIAPNFRGTKIS